VRSDDLTGWCHFAAAYNSSTKTCKEYAEKLVEFQRHILKLIKQHMYMLGHIGNEEQASVFKHAIEHNRGREGIKML
jgi:hypothetical protein